MKKILLYLNVFIFISACNNKPEPIQDPIPTHDTFELKSLVVNEDRTINVWTPPVYSETTDSFPVLYMPDGGIKEDFPHIANTLAALVESKSIPPFILVGIENTERRRDLSGASQVADDEQYAPLTDGAKDFRAFISDELFAEINKRYRTAGTKGIVGESLAGLFVVETFLLKPDLFDFFIAMDPSVWWNGQHLVKTTSEHLANFPSSEKRFWFAGSGAEDISKYTNQLAQLLEKEAPTSIIWKYSDEPNEKHNTIFRATKEKAFVWSMGLGEN
jgi:hypothetical protein